MNRKLIFQPAFDRTDPDPKKNYGVGCLELLFMVFGDKGAVQLQLLTQWYLPHVMDRRLESLKQDIRMGKEDFLLKDFIEPHPIDLCYFRPDRSNEDETFFDKGVPYFMDGASCYYGYKYLDADERVAKDVAFRKLVDEGDEALWKYLEDYYVEVFGNGTSNS